MQAQKGRSHDKITTNDVYFSGDESQPGNHRKRRNSGSRRRRSAKELNKRNLISKQNQTAETLEWLSENYELVQGVCVPRCVLYTHYLDFCKKRKFSPAGPATFGKLIRQRFPKLTTRRLGTRGQSKYHYYGISIKESSVYYHSVYSGKGLTRFSGTEERKKGITKKFCFDKKGNNTLPEFPSASEMILGEDLSVQKVETFIIMYRTHCQRLLDTVMNANFNEVHKFLLHFWRGMPQHMVPVLECDAVIDIIVVCDSLLYKIFNDVLVPSCIQDIPDSLTEEIHDFAVTFVHSLESCLENTPLLLKSQKVRVAKNFVRLLKRNMTFINLAQTARPVFLSYESMSGILNEFRCLDLRKILSELLFLTEQENVELPVLLMFMEEFENLLMKQAPIEAYAEWFDSIVEEYVLKDETNMIDASDNLSKRSQTFLTSWSFITSRILQELTLKGAPTFGSFQLIIMMFEEYILLIIENQMITQLDEDLKLGLTRHLKQSGVRETSIIQEGSITQDQSHRQQQMGLNKQQEKQKQKNSKQRHQSTQNNLSDSAKDQQMLLFQNIQREIQHFETSESQPPNAEPYEVQKHSFYHLTQQRPEPHAGQLHINPSTPENNFPTGEVYLGVNAVPSEIHRIENIRGNHAHIYNAMCTQNQGNNFEFSRVSAQNNTQNSSQSMAHNNFQAHSYAGSGYKNHFEPYHVEGQTGQGQPIEGQFQGQFQGHYQVQGQTTGQSSNQGHLEGQIHLQVQSSNQCHLQGQSYLHNEGHQNQGNQGQGQQGQGQQSQGQEFKGHQVQGQNPGHFKDYQYESQVHNLDHSQEYHSQNQDNHSDNQNSSFPDQNMNFSQTSNTSSNYLFTESVSIGRHSSQANSLIYTTQSNINYQEKTTLPSFFQLSSQLSSNTRLSAGY